MRLDKNEKFSKEKKNRTYYYITYSYSAYKIYNIYIGREKETLPRVTLLFMHQIKWEFFNTFHYKINNI